MYTGLAILLLRKEDFLLPALMIILLGLAILAGGVPAAGFVVPLNEMSLVMVLLTFVVFVAYFFLKVRRLSEMLGHGKGIEREEIPVRIIKIAIFFLLMSVISFIFPPAALLFLIFILYPFAVAIDDVGEMDNILSSLDVWRKNPLLFVEFFLVSSVFILTAAFIEVFGGSIGIILSFLMIYLFVLPFILNLLTLYYLIRYPLLFRHVEL